METRIRALIDDYERFIGVDHHKRSSYVTIKDREGDTVKRGSIPTSREALSMFLDGEAGGDGRSIAVFEAGRCYRPMYRWLSEEVDQVVLAHPGGLKIISDTVYKDDKMDSGKLADLLMLGMIPEAHPASDDAWEKRRVLRHRMMLVRMQTEVKNRIHNLVDLYPDALPRKPEVSDLFGKLGMSWLERLELPDQERKRLDELIEIHDFLKEKIAVSDSLVRKMAREDKRCRLLKTIPGIGDFFACLIAAEVDDINRFPKSKNFASSIGLVTARDDSGDVERPGRMHKRGNKYLRWALVEAAIPATRSNLALKNLYDRLVERKGKKAGPNIAKVAVARKLSEIVYRVLKDERPYEYR